MISWFPRWGRWNDHWRHCEDAWASSAVNIEIAIDEVFGRHLQQTFQGRQKEILAVRLEIIEKVKSNVYLHLQDGKLPTKESDRTSKLRQPLDIPLEKTQSKKKVSEDWVAQARETFEVQKTQYSKVILSTNGTSKDAISELKSTLKLQFKTDNM
ncbi:hypothetical protein K440DRAFT_643330 [Wilcoxina mikolae CBS 423.85]|nr:hypothetical protein K440DRAFT_643330 [Wilcoxina mikolae CBS 423.85]